MSVPSPTGPNVRSEDRRDSPRIEVPARIKAHLLSMMTVPITLVQISRGGFSMQLSHECRVGEIHDVRFWSDPGSPVVLSPVVLTATVVHALRTTDTKGATLYVAGLEFLEQERPHIHKAIESLVKSVEDDPPAE